MRRLSPIAHQIWDLKYRLKGPDGTVLDASVEDTWARVAAALATPEAPQVRTRWAQDFARALMDFRFLPAGRILAGAGSGRTVTLFNCFVMDRVPDDLSGIFAVLRDSARTMQQGGGIGVDFSTIRPKGAPVAGVGADASGPVSFMDVWDAMCRTVMSAGSRRGAMMATLRCDHPDIEAFIDAKREPGRLTNFNVSVLATDAFMDAVAADAEWPLVFAGRTYRTVRARALWDRIMAATYAYAEPGVIFIDRINAANNLAYCETIHSVNPCGEQALPPNGACDLGSVNLARLVDNPFTGDAALDEAALAELAAVGVRLLDNVIDASNYPLSAQAEEARAKRRIGLGVTGLADALAMMGVVYGSDESVALIRRWFGVLRRAAYLASAELAAEKGPFPLFDRDAFLAAPNVRALDADVCEAIASHGVRNGVLTSIAPTGTISLLAGNVSSGIEPIFATSYTRKVLLPDGSRAEQEVVDYAVQLYRDLHGRDAVLPPAFVTAQTLPPEAHVRVQAAAQAFIDSAISKTINVPADLPFDAFQDVYRLAYDSGCKGCTTYRPSAVRGAVLEAAPSESAAPAEPARARPKPVRADGGVVYMMQPLARPEALEGATYKLKWPDSDHALYITLNDLIENGRRRPFEIFINSKNMEHYAWTVALTRMISAVFRRGGDVSFVVEELKAVFDPRGGQWMEGRYVPSLLAAIGDIIEKHMIAIGFILREGAPGLAKLPLAVAGGDAADGGEPAGLARVRPCPRCGAAALIRIEGCDTCSECGYSKCG